MIILKWILCVCGGGLVVKCSAGPETGQRSIFLVFCKNQNNTAEKSREINLRS
jgi:hypothetical protein